MQEYADSLGIPFIETSAKNSTNIEKAFVMMAREIKNRMINSGGGQTITPTSVISGTRLEVPPSDAKTGCDC